MDTLISLFALISTLGSPHNCIAKHLRVAIVDTGLDLNDPRFQGHLCAVGHRSFTGDLKDTYGHGTHVAGLIQKYAGDADYCFLIYKYYDEKNKDLDNFAYEVEAFEQAVADGADIVNFSGGGPASSVEEMAVIRDNPQVLFVVAAGNENKDIDIPENHYYPASYPLKNVIVVGNVDKRGNRVPSSNWGKKVDFVEDGDNVKSFLPGGKEGRMTGTSQATAIHTGKMLAIRQTMCDSK